MWPRMKFDIEIVKGASKITFHGLVGFRFDDAIYPRSGSEMVTLRRGANERDLVDLH